MKAIRNFIQRLKAEVKKNWLLYGFCFIALLVICVIFVQLSAYNEDYYNFELLDPKEHSVIFASVSDEYPNPNIIKEGVNKLPGFVKDPNTGLEYKVTGIGKMSFNYGDYFVNQENDDPPTVELPETIEFIDEAAFIYCSNLTSITLPSSLKRIERWAFFGNTSLTSIYCHSETPPELGPVVFMGTYDYDTKTYYSLTEDCTLYVPAGSELSYKDWGGYKWKDIKALP